MVGMVDMAGKTSVIEARELKKTFGNTKALDGFNLVVPRGKIVGLIGPNGSGKTTALKSILGFCPLDAGQVSVLGLDPWRQRARIMQRVAYIADTGILPKWMRVTDLLDYVARVHPCFDRDRAVARLAGTDVQLSKRVRALSKGMHVQLHLAIVLAIEAEVLILDEPTLGLDIIHRQQFYDGILNEFFNPDRSVLVTTHQVREIEDLLTDIVFIHRGVSRLACAMTEVAARFQKVRCAEGVRPPGQALYEHRLPAGVEYIFENADPGLLAGAGEVLVPNLAELFVALTQATVREVPVRANDQAGTPG